MEEVLSKLKTLTPDQLRQQVIGAGLKCGPITATTRAIFERKLARALQEKPGGDGSNCGSSSSNEEARGPTDREEGASDHSSELISPAKEGIMERGAVPCKETEDLSQPESPPVYYGVCPQWEDSMVRDDKIHVYMDRKKALRAMTTMKGSRFKGFSTREEAEKFAEGINDHVASASLSTSDGPQGILEPVVHTGSPITGGSSPGNLEKANEFRSPRTQDLTAKLRKAVEKGDQAAFSKLVWDNPRYLIGSGDNPTIVHEGCHYNVLHVASKENQSGIAQLLLDTLESPEFMRLMYPDDQEAMLHQRIRYIVDLYLNTPDKGGNETPLHFACKFGCPDMVNVLCSHPATDKHRKNKYSQKPSSVICERKNKTTDIKKKIKEYLEDRCYIPLLRDTDNSFQPVIGLPWSPCPLEVDLHSLGSGVAGSPIDPVMTVRAYMGPLSPSKADELYRRWRTPPRDQAEYFHCILKSDPDRGAERVGREIAHDMGHPWAEYWDFLDSFIDLSTEEGLKRLEDYLEKKEHSEPSREEYRGTEATSEEVRSSKEKKKHNPNHVQSNHILKDNNSPPKDRSSLSPVCNLLPEFDKASLKSTVKQQDEVESEEGRLAPSVPGTGNEGLDLGDDSFWRTWGRSQGRGDVEELSSTCSEDYLTADEGSVGSGCHRERGERKGSGSSSSSYKSTGDTSVDTVVTAHTPTRQGLFIEGVSPTKLDRDVISAVHNMEIDPERYPCITQWRDTILAYPSPQRLSWPSPMGKRSFTGAQDGTPSRLSSMWRPGLHSPSQSAYTQNMLCRNLFRSPH